MVLNYGSGASNKRFIKKIFAYFYNLGAIFALIRGIKLSSPSFAATQH